MSLQLHRGKAHSKQTKKKSPEKKTKHQSYKKKTKGLNSKKTNSKEFQDNFETVFLLNNENTNDDEFEDKNQKDMISEGNINISPSSKEKDTSDLLKDLEKDLKCELFDLKDDLDNFQVKNNDQTNHEYFEFEDCKDIKLEDDIVERKPESHLNNDQVITKNPENFVFEEDKEIKFEYDVKKEKETYQNNDLVSDKNINFHVCPYDSCTFMTSTLTDFIINDHFAHNHPDADPLERIKFLPL